jgi:hypothetical protein
MMGRKIIVQAVVGGITQFLAMAQGMPPNVESALIKIIRKFMWGADSSPRLTLDVLQSPVENGGLYLLTYQQRSRSCGLSHT